jgi:hypothetical protein
MLVIHWGFNQGPTGVAGYMAVVGALALILIAGPLALFLARASAVAALLSVVVDVCALGLRFAQPGNSAGLALLAAVPLAAVSWVAVRSIRQAVSMVRSGAGVSRPWISAALIVFAYAIFFFIFNGGPLVGTLLGLRKSA